MSADAKIWRDKSGWHGICDAVQDRQYDATEYGLSELIILVENQMGQALDWDVFEYQNGMGLRGFRARPSDVR